MMPFEATEPFKMLPGMLYTQWPGLPKHIASELVHNRPPSQPNRRTHDKFAPRRDLLLITEFAIRNVIDSPVHLGSRQSWPRLVCVDDRLPCCWPSPPVLLKAVLLGNPTSLLAIEKASQRCVIY